MLPVHAPWFGPLECPQAGSRAWRWPAGGVEPDLPTATSPVQQEKQTAAVFEASEKAGVVLHLFKPLHRVGCVQVNILLILSVSF